MIAKLIEVKALKKYKIHLQYADGTAGDVDLAHLAGRGVFQAWDEGDLFSRVFIDTETRAVAWNETLDLCPDTLYLKLKNMTFAEWQNQHAIAHATN